MYVFGLYSFLESNLLLIQCEAVMDVSILLNSTHYADHYDELFGSTKSREYFNFCSDY
jgi:hypothetical protein